MKAAADESSILVDSDFLIERLAPDRTLAEPVYRQMARRMRELVAIGAVPDGQSLPAERILAERLNVSRTTVRRFSELRQSHELVVSGRNGATVTRPRSIQPPLGKLKGFTSEMRECGVEPSTRLLERAIVADRTIASMINAPSTTQFLKLVRLRLGDGVPMSRETAWYNLSLAPDLEDWNVEGSAYDYIQHRCGVRLVNAEQSIEAVSSSPEECVAFGLSAPLPCLLFKRRTHAASGQIVEYAEGVFRGDIYVYHLKLT
ncbi:MAG: GntR family transcriptional regulator [Rhodoblastus sp.]|nr:MAG: GntR family transcriptional regulator [Rhodoblastus sp.]